MSTNIFRLICLFALLLGHGLWAKVIFVDDNASEGGDGTSWSTAHKYLQDALAVAEYGDEIWVAEGTYKPDQGAGQILGNREASFIVKDNISLIGGFVGNESSPDPLGRPDHTILSGNINEDSTYWSLRVLNTTGRNGTIKNLTIKNGNANGSWDFAKGSALYDDGMRGFENCIFRECHGANALYVSMTSYFYRCVFEDVPIHVHSEALFDNCILIGSTCQVNYATFKNCTIFTQVQHHGITSTLVINSIFQSLPIRSKNPYALGFDPDQVGPWTNRKVLLEGISSQYPGDPNARDGIVSAPNASNIGAASGAGYYQNFDIFVPLPTFRNIDDPVGPDQLWFSNDDGLQLSDDASAINSGSTPHLFNTYDQYTSFVNSGSIGLTDIMGKNRVNGSSVDIGAYEYYFVPQYNVSEVNSSAGTINGGGQYYADTEATLQADPTAGYSFLKWEGDLDSSINPIKVPVTKNLSVSAKFVSTAIINLAKGATNPSPNWFSNSWFGTFFTSDSTWIYHSVLGWLYVHPVDDLSYWMWSSEYGWLWFHKEHFPFLYSNKYTTWLWLSRSSSDLFIFGDSTKTWNYYFDSVKTISVSLEPEGAGVVTGVGEYSKGSSVSLNANADNYHQFMYWKKDNQVVSQNADYSFVVDENVNLVAVFEGQGNQEVDYATVTLGVFPLNSGGVFIKDSQSSWVEKSTSFNFPVGEILSIKPNIAGYNHYFQSWSLPDGSVSTNETITVDVDSNLTLGLNLLNSFKLSLSSTGVTTSHFTLLDGSDVPLFFEDMASPNISYWKQGANVQVKTFAGGYKSDELPYPWERWQGFRNTFTLGIQMNEDLEIVAAWPE